MPTVILNTNRDGVVRAYIIPEGDPALTEEGASIRDVVQEAMESVTSEHNHIQEAARRQRRKDAVVATLRREGVGPKKAYRLAEAALAAADEVK